MTSNKIKLREPFQPGHLAIGGLQIECDYLCVDCKKPFTATTGTALRCVACRKIHDKAWQKKYHAKYVKKKKKVLSASSS